MKKVLSIVLCTVVAVSCMSFSASAKSVKVKAPKMKSVTNVDTTTQKIKWSKVKNISGYQVYYKVSGGKFKKLRDFSKNTNTYTIKKLKTNKKYFYKVKAYKKSGTKTYYSNFSTQLGKKTTNCLMNLVQPYSTAWQGYSDYTAPNTVKLSGKDYTNGFGLDPSGYAYFNLEGKYKKITFTAGVRDGSAHDCAFSIISDDSVVKTITLKANDLPKKYTANIENASKLQFQGTDGWMWNDITIVNIKVYK